MRVNDMSSGSADLAGYEGHCFFVTPLGAEDSETRARADELQSLIEEVVAEHSLRVLRSDQIGEPGMITDQIVRAIIQSRMVFADLTGANANVYYELGVAHSLDRPVVTLIDKARNLTFDTAHDRAVIIGDDGRLSLAQARRVREKLAQFVSAVTSGRFRARNVVTQAASAASVDSLAGDDPVVSLLSQMHDEIAELRRLLEESWRSRESPEVSDARLMRLFIERMVGEGDVDPGQVRNALVNGRTSAEQDEWVEALVRHLTSSRWPGM